MKYDEFLKIEAARKVKGRPRDLEHQLQVACVNWFRYQFPEYRDLLFAVPNGGRRDKVTGGKLKAEGVLAGVADLLLLLPNQIYHGACIELKTRSGRQRESQKAWQSAVESAGYRYEVVRSVDEFKNFVRGYLVG